MALKSKEWFYKQCLRHMEERTRLGFLCWDIVSKGIGQKDSTRGHVTQAIGATQKFLMTHPEFRAVIRAADPTTPFDIRAHDDVLQAWTDWLQTQPSTSYGPKAFGYSMRTFKGLLTRTLGGRLTHGGGGTDEFKRVLRLMPEFED
jgi:hypothetical protein